MALVLKDTKTYTDSAGNVYNDAYGVVDHIDIDKHNQTAKIKFQIYKDQAARNSSLDPIIPSFTYFIEGTDYTTHFAVSALNPVNKNIFTNAYAFLLALQDDSGSNIWTDWESDE